jgi:hypothetical protein
MLLIQAVVVLQARHSSPLSDLIANIGIRIRKGRRHRHRSTT